MPWKELCHKLAPKVFKVIRIYSRKNKKALQIGLSVHLKPDKSSYRRR